MNTRLLSAATLVLGTCLVALGPTATALAETTPDCPDGAVDATFGYRISGGSAKVTVDRAGCTPERTYHVSSYTLDQSAENTSTDFGSNPYAFPQTLFAHGADIRVPKGYVALGTTWTSTVAVPRCGDYQDDLYSGPVLERVDADGHPGYVAGGIVLQAECAPAAPVTSAPPVPPVTPEPTTSSTTTSSSTTSVTMSSSPATSPTPSGTSPTSATGTLPATTTTATTVSASSTTSAAPASSAATTTRATTTTVRAAGAPLALTGATGTTSLVAVAGGLLALGVGAVALTRRARAQGSHTNR